MSKEERKVPELRFKGFHDDWEQRTLNQELSLLKDGTHGTHKNVANGLYLLSAKNIKNGEILITEQDRQISREEFNKIHRNFVLHSGDVLLTVVGSIGETAILTKPKDVTFQRSVAYLRPSQMKSQFLYNLIQTVGFQNELKKKQVVSAQPGVYLGDLKKISIKMTKNATEQIKISQFTQLIDKIITLHQRKINILEKINLEFLKKMFPDYNQDSLNLRFRDFKENWERKKLIQVVQSTYQGINTAADKVKYSSIGVPILQAKHITNGKISFKEARYLDKENYQYYFPKYAPKNGDILFANIGTIGTSLVVKTSQEFLIAWNILKITLKNDTDSRFVQTYLTLLRNRNFFESITTGNATKFINKDEVLKIQLPLPLIDEQETIGRFIYEIDDIIKNHQVKINQLNVLKKIYLRKMFL